MQTRLQSLIESVVNIAIGFAVAACMTKWIFGVTAQKAVGVTVIYTTVSMVRAYAVRRAFNGWHK